MCDGPKDQNDNTGRDFEDILDELYRQEEPTERQKSSKEEDEED